MECACCQVFRASSRNAQPARAGVLTSLLRSSDAPSLAAAALAALAGCPPAAPHSRYRRCTAAGVCRRQSVGRAPRGPPIMSHYNVLGLRVEADAADIRAAYRERAVGLHPSAGGDPERFARLQVGRPPPRLQRTHTHLPSGRAARTPHTGNAPCTILHHCGHCRPGQRRAPPLAAAVTG